VETFGLRLSKVQLSNKPGIFALLPTVVAASAAAAAAALSSFFSGKTVQAMVVLVAHKVPELLKIQLSPEFLNFSGTLGSRFQGINSASLSM
jgi:hypothetical protein